MEKKLMVMSNVDPGANDMLFHNDIGSWNVSRALRDCKLGKHKLYMIGVAEAYRANAGIEVDEAKVTAFAEVLAIGGKIEPGLGVIEDGKIWFIDGHHRLRAMARLSINDFACYIIEEEHSKPYIVLYNGQRKPPFRAY